MFFDTLPFPNITAKDADERSKQTVDYLIQFKEELEFLLNGIVNNDYGKLLPQSPQAAQTMQPIMSNSREDALTVAEVVNSASFRAALNGVKEETMDSIPAEVGKQLPDEVARQMPDIIFTVNFDNGYLEYTIK